jgi:hypothetical protein
MSRSRIFHLHGNFTITGEGLQNLGLNLRSVLSAFEEATTAVTRGLGVSGLIRRTSHSIASYDTQRIPTYDLSQKGLQHFIGY